MNIKTRTKLPDVIEKIPYKGYILKRTTQTTIIEEKISADDYDQIILEADKAVLDEQRARQEAVTDKAGILPADGETKP